MVQFVIFSVLTPYIKIALKIHSGLFNTGMIKAILVFNNHGKPRLLKFYQHYVSLY